MQTCKIIGIGVNKYDDPAWGNLNNCQADINNITEILVKKYDFGESALFLEAEQTTKSAIYNCLLQTLLSVGKNESILIIFAGHGLYNERLRSTYWIPSDGMRMDSSTWLDLAQVTNIMKASDALHISLIADCCFSGGILSAQTRGGGVTAFSSKKSRFAITSGSLEPVSDGVDGKGSPFANIIVDVLQHNQEQLLTFQDFCSKVIINFSGDRKQTPKMGGIEGTGHDGGSMVLHAKKPHFAHPQYKITELRLPVIIDSRFSFEHDCVIPFILKDGQYSALYLNHKIQELAYGAIDEARGHYDDYLLTRDNIHGERSYNLSIGYSIHLKTDRLISLSVNVDHEFGGPHPHFAFYYLNFDLKEEIVLTLKDVVDLQHFRSFDDFLQQMILNYSYNEDQREILDRYKEYLTETSKDFYLTSTHLVIDFHNTLPFAFRVLGPLEIPRDSVSLLI
jgi:hypothetical protein